METRQPEASLFSLYVNCRKPGWQMLFQLRRTGAVGMQKSWRRKASWRWRSHCWTGEHKSVYSSVFCWNEKWCAGLLTEYLFGSFQPDHRPDRAAACAWGENTNRERRTSGPAAQYDHREHYCQTGEPEPKGGTHSNVLCFTGSVLYSF